jgi:hypothetical protein
MRSKGRKMFAALVAVLALGVVASASASAALPEFVPSAGVKFPIKLEGAKTGEWLMSDAKGGPAIRCTGSKIAGEITGPKAVSLTVELEGCASKTYGTCASKELAEGHMVAYGDGKLVYLSKTSKTVGTILTMPNFGCGTWPLAGIKSKGGQLIQISPVNKKGSTMELYTIGNGAGFSNLKEYENEEGVKKLEYLRWEEGSGEGEADMETAGKPTLTAPSQFTLEA